MKFYNREKELEFLRQYFELEPNSILVLYGPKSCGKSTLLTKAIESLDLKKYAVNFISLRSVLIYDFKSFLEVFFPKSTTEKALDIFEGITMDLGFFSIKAGDEALLKRNPFKLMKEKLEAAQRRGIRPVIILDEVQILREIHLNGERRLIDELLNLLIELTKVKQIAHVVLASSDSFYINYIFESAKMKKTSELYFVDHLDENSTLGWLLEEGFSPEEAGEIYKFLGGSVWEIRQFISRRDKQLSVEENCYQLFINEETGKLQYFRNFKLQGDLLSHFDQLLAVMVKDGHLKIRDYQGSEVESLLQTMVEKESWFFHTGAQVVLPNSRSNWWAMKEIMERNQKK